MISDWERIQNQFESRSICKYKQKPLISCEPGCVWIECKLEDQCRCRMHADSGEPLTPFLMEWEKRFG